MDLAKQFPGVKTDLKGHLRMETILCGRYSDRNLQHNENISQQLPQYVYFRTVLKKMSLWFYRGWGTEKLHINSDNYPVSMIAKGAKGRKHVKCLLKQLLVSSYSNASE